jgi:hypothetical protein
MMVRSVLGVQATALVQAMQQMAKQSPHVHRVLVAVPHVLFISNFPFGNQDHL